MSWLLGTARRTGVGEIPNGSGEDGSSMPENSKCKDLTSMCPNISLGTMPGGDGLRVIELRGHRPFAKDPQVSKDPLQHFIVIDNESSPRLPLLFGDWDLLPQ